MLPLPNVSKMLFQLCLKMLRKLKYGRRPEAHLLPTLNVIIIHWDMSVGLPRFRSSKVLRLWVRERVRYPSWRRHTASRTEPLWWGCRQKCWKGCTCTAQWEGWVYRKWGDWVACKKVSLTLLHHANTVNAEELNSPSFSQLHCLRIIY